VIASAGPGTAVAGAQQRIDLVVDEVQDQRLVVTFGRERQNAADAVGVFRMSQCREPKQRVDRGESGVAGPDAVAALAFQIVEKTADPGCVEVGDVHSRRCEPGAVGAVAQQQT
jgi:hypothetical protein